MAAPVLGANAERVEVPLANHEAARASDPPADGIVARILAGRSTRNYPVGLEPVGNAIDAVALRTRRTIGRSQHASTKGQGRRRDRGRGLHPGTPTPRPRTGPCPGTPEGDLVAGSANTHIATLVEHQTRYLRLVNVPGKDAARVVDALAIQIRTLSQ